MTEQTLKDIDRAFKALEERDELLDKIKAEIEALSKTYAMCEKRINELEDKLKKLQEESEE